MWLVPLRGLGRLGTCRKASLLWWSRQMKQRKRNNKRYIKNGIRALVVAMASIGAATTSIQAQQSQAYVVGNDRGGLLLDRIENIRQLRATGQPVHIQGRICYSTCTMYLGLEQTCISPQTTFGFHGPSSYGRALDADLFRRTSSAIARHYPEPLREWYMREGRHEIRSIYRFSGAEIIKMGVKQC